MVINILKLKKKQSRNFVLELKKLEKKLNFLIFVLKLNLKKCIL